VRLRYFVLRGASYSARSGHVVMNVLNFVTPAGKFIDGLGNQKLFHLEYDTCILNTSEGADSPQLTAVTSLRITHFKNR